jgi:hypothetical protein
MKNDSQLQGSVLDEIKWWPNVDAAHIGVAAQDAPLTFGVFGVVSAKSTSLGSPTPRKVARSGTIEHLGMGL